jgi:hypothetical protein
MCSFNHADAAKLQVFRYLSSIMAARRRLKRSSGCLCHFGADHSRGPEL